jgi:hypothetical protein
MDLRSTEINEVSAREFALGGVVPFLQSGDVQGIPGSGVMDGFRLENLIFKSRTSLFGAKPLDLYDTEGRLTFRDFVTPVEGGQEIRVRTVANALLGRPVISVGVGRPFPIGSWLAEAEDVSRQQNLVPLDGPERLVCYSYPKLGLLCKVPLLGKKYVIDLADRSVLAVTDHSFGSKASDLLTTWSPFDGVERSSVPRLTERWSAGVEVLRARLSLGVELAELVNKAQETAQQRVLDLNLHPQSTETNCAAATAWMILDYHGVHLPIPEGVDVSELSIIGKFLNIGSAGATNEDQVAGYMKIFPDSFEVMKDQDPEFAEAMMEINTGGGRPLKSGIVGHARVVAGWKIEPTSQGLIRSLWIYDPYPTNFGFKHWENWGTVQYGNYIFVRRKAA